MMRSIFRYLVAFLSFNGVVLLFLWYRKQGKKSKSLPNHDYNALFKGMSLPACFVDIDVLESNLKILKRRSRGKNIRVATKSIRCLEILHRVSQGSLMTFCAVETKFLADEGFDDILLAYPICDERDAKLVCQARQKCSRLWVIRKIEEKNARVEYSLSFRNGWFE